MGIVWSRWDCVFFSEPTEIGPIETSKKRSEEDVWGKLEVWCVWEADIYLSTHDTCVHAHIELDFVLLVILLQDIAVEMHRWVKLILERSHGALKSYFHLSPLLILQILVLNKRVTHILVLFHWCSFSTHIHVGLIAVTMYTLSEGSWYFVLSRSYVLLLAW